MMKGLVCETYGGAAVVTWFVWPREKIGQASWPPACSRREKRGRLLSLLSGDQQQGLTEQHEAATLEIQVDYQKKVLH